VQSNDHRTIIAGIVGLVSVGAFLIPALSIISIVFILPALPFEYISGWIVGGNSYPLKLIVILCMEFVLFAIFCYWYFKKLIEDKKKSEKFNEKRLLLFFLLLQLIVHPIGFYTWLLINSDMDPNDGMNIFYGVLTIPYSGLVFIVLGVLIDLIRNRSEKENRASSLDS
jgi:MFS family permease